MKKHNLFLMCGIPGSGKSTWAAKQEDALIISRDAIRFEMVPEDAEYFSKEDEVFATYLKRLQEALDDDNTPTNIYGDATHINERARKKVLNALDLSNVENVTVIVVRPSLAESWRRNLQRTGRALVPYVALRRMWNSFERPEDDKDKIFDTIYVEVP